MNLSNSQLEMLMNLVSTKSGVSKEQLKSELDKGTFDRLMSTLPADEANKLTAALSNPATAKLLVNSPQAKELIKKLFG